VPKNGSADDVAALVSYFVSKEAHFVTGACSVQLKLPEGMLTPASATHGYRSNCESGNAKDRGCENRY
jgi:hypothetical protein